jgi:hypothetical protein
MLVIYFPVNLDQLGLNPMRRDAFFSLLTLVRRLRQHVPHQYWHLSNKLHGVTPKNTVML